MDGADLCSFANEQRGPSLLATAWRHAGMGVTHARLKAVSTDHVDLSVVVCDGDVCSSKLVTVPLNGLTAQEWLASLSVSPPAAFLWQPLTLLTAAAIVGFALVKRLVFLWYLLLITVVSLVLGQSFQSDMQFS